MFFCGSQAPQRLEFVFKGRPSGYGQIFFCQGLHGVRRAVGERIKGGAVLYGGATAQSRSDWQAWPVGHLPNLLGLAERLFMDA